MKNVFLLMVAPLLLVALGFGQTPAPSTNTDPASISGCLSGSDGNYTVAEDGTTQIYKVTSSTVDLSPHVGHDIAVTGQKTTATSAGPADNSVVVTGVSMISDHCATATAGAPAVVETTPAATTTTPVVVDSTPVATATPPATDSAPVATASTPAAADPTPVATASDPAQTASAPATETAASAPESTEQLPNTATSLPLLGLLGLGLLGLGLLTSKFLSRRTQTNEASRF